MRTFSLRFTRMVDSAVWISHSQPTSTAQSVALDTVFFDLNRSVLDLSLTDLAPVEAVRKISCLWAGRRRAGLWARGWEPWWGHLFGGCDFTVHPVGPGPRGFVQRASRVPWWWEYQIFFKPKTWVSFWIPSFGFHHDASGTWNPVAHTCHCHYLGRVSQLQIPKTSLCHKELQRLFVSMGLKELGNEVSGWDVEMVSLCWVFPCFPDVFLMAELWFLIDVIWVWRPCRTKLCTPKPFRRASAELCAEQSHQDLAFWKMVDPHSRWWFPKISILNGISLTKTIQLWGVPSKIHHVFIYWGMIYLIIPIDINWHQLTSID